MTAVAPALLPSFLPAAFPRLCEPLEEVSAETPADAAAALAFALDRLVGEKDAAAARPVVLVTTPLWLRERGRPFARGMALWGCDLERLVWVKAERDAEALWALEEALKSGVVAGGLATVETPAFVTTRRLDFAARAGRASAVLVRADGAAGDLSAARRRWRVMARPSTAAAFDAAAPGPAGFRATLVRRRDGPPGAWDLEQDDATGRLRVASGLADHGVDEAGQPGCGRASRAA